MDCINCPLLKKAKAEIEALQRDQDMAFMLMKIVASIAEDYRKKLIQHVGMDKVSTENIIFDELLEKLRNRSAEAAAEINKELEKIMLDQK